MVVVVAYYQFNMNDIDFGWYWSNFTEQAYYPNVPDFDYLDVYAVAGYNGGDAEFALSLAGNLASTMSLTASADWTGTVNVIVEVASTLYDPLWTAEGLSMSAASLQSAMKTTGTADDIALMKKALSGADTFLLSDDGDRAYGYSGIDTMKGYGGNDYLRGGTGQDKLYGGTGADDFIYNDGETGKTSTTRDIIYDFVKGTDDLDLRYVDANTKKSGDQAFVYSGTTADNNEVWYKKSGANVIVYGDNSGDGVADFAIELRNVSSLSAGDFLL